MTAEERILTDEQWSRIAPLIERKGTAGAPKRTPRLVFEGILHRYKFGITWSKLPEEYGPWKTLWRRHQVISGDGTLAKAIHQLVDEDEPDDNLQWLVPLAKKWAADDSFED